MQTCIRRVKEDEKTKKSIEHRNELIKEAIKVGLKIYRPQEMAIRELEALVQQHYKNNQ